MRAKTEGRRCAVRFAVVPQDVRHKTCAVRALRPTPHAAAHLHGCSWRTKRPSGTSPSTHAPHHRPRNETLIIIRNNGGNNPPAAARAVRPGRCWLCTRCCCARGGVRGLPGLLLLSPYLDRVHWRPRGSAFS
jgi:hypothetical protein